MNRNLQLAGIVTILAAIRRVRPIETRFKREGTFHVMFRPRSRDGRPHV